MCVENEELGVERVWAFLNLLMYVEMLRWFL